MYTDMYDVHICEVYVLVDRTSCITAGRLRSGLHALPGEGHLWRHKRPCAAAKRTIELRSRSIILVWNPYMPHAPSP